MNDPVDDNQDTLDTLPSKSQRKRESHALVKMGETICQLKTDEIRSLELPDELDEAVQVARKIRSNSGLKRQRQYIGKLLRHADHEQIAIRLNKIKHRHDTNTAAFKRLENWRNRLVEGDRQVLTELLTHYPDLDRQHVHQLARQALRERQKAQAPAAARKLFRYLQQLEDAKVNNG